MGQFDGVCDLGRVTGVPRFKEVGNWPRLVLVAVTMGWEQFNIVRRTKVPNGAMTGTAA